MAAGREQIKAEIARLRLKAADLYSVAHQHLETAIALEQQIESTAQPINLPFYPYRPWETWQLNPADRPTIPHALNFAGVYIWIDHLDQYLYVGQSTQISIRLKDHFVLGLNGPDHFIYQGHGKRIDPPRLLIARVSDINKRNACEWNAIEFCDPVFNQRAGRRGPYAP